MTEMKHEFGGNVVSLVHRLAQVSFPAINQVDAYWEGLRCGRLMPERAEIDPRGLESALEYAFMLEHVAPGVARIRIAGMHLNDILGMEVRGMPLTAFINPEDRKRLGRALDRVVNTPQVADIKLSSPRSIGRPGLQARLYLAPLASGDLGHPRILGCLQSEGDIGRAPRRFAMEQVHLRRIVASAQPAERLPQEVSDTPAPAPARNELAEPRAEFAHALRKSPEKPESRPNLRLVKTDS